MRARQCGKSADSRGRLPRPRRRAPPHACVIHARAGRAGAANPPTDSRSRSVRSDGSRSRRAAGARAPLRDDDLPRKHGWRLFRPSLARVAGAFASGHWPHIPPTRSMVQCPVRLDRLPYSGPGEASAPGVPMDTAKRLVMVVGAVVGATLTLPSLASAATITAASCSAADVNLPSRVPGGTREEHGGEPHDWLSASGRADVHLEQHEGWRPARNQQRPVRWAFAGVQGLLQRPNALGRRLRAGRKGLLHPAAPGR